MGGIEKADRVPAAVPSLPVSQSPERTPDRPGYQAVRARPSVSKVKVSVVANSKTRTRGPSWPPGQRRRDGGDLWFFLGEPLPSRVQPTEKWSRPMRPIRHETRGDPCDPRTLTAYPPRSVLCCPSPPWEEPWPNCVYRPASNWGRGGRAGGAGDALLLRCVALREGYLGYCPGADKLSPWDRPPIGDGNCLISQRSRSLDLWAPAEKSLSSTSSLSRQPGSCCCCRSREETRRPPLRI